MKNQYALSFLILIAFTLTMLQPVKAQRMLGMMNDNYSGASSMYYQPASIVDSRMKFDVELMGMGFYAGNNFLNIKRSVVSDIFKDYSKLRDASFYDTYVTENFNGKNKDFYIELETRLFTAMIPINETNSLGFGVRVRAIGNVSDIDEDALALYFRDNNDPIRFGEPIQYDDASQQFSLWTEYNLTYARVLLDKKQHFVKGGATVKLLQGMGAMYIYEKELGYSLANSDTAVNIDADIKVGMSTNVDQMIEDLSKGQVKLIDKPSIGFDIGFVYEWRPDWKKFKYDMDGKKDLWRRDLNKYKLRAGISIVDVGSMRYEKQYGINDISFHDNLVNIKQWEFTDYPQDVFDTLNNRYGVTGAEKDFKMRLPTSINISADYHIVKGFYTSFTGRLALNQGSRYYSKVHVLNNLTLTPRYEMKYLGVFIPMQYSQVSGFNFGLGARIGPVYFGSADLLGLLGAQEEINGMGFYFGFKVPIVNRKTKDKDGDAVSDRLDECKNDKGLWEFQGCPDTDGDSIPDRDDDCPTKAGLKVFKGCPDTDGDGVEDKMDECPAIAGLKIYNGCPDADEDGIIDKRDSCVQVVGTEEFFGCPDSDGDKIPDHRDDCPTKAGLKHFKGCPDTDLDGIQDAFDKCPTVAGLDSLEGCPFIDTDNDGLRDERDNCPTIAGPRDNKGCPIADTDNDSVPDSEDLCPLTPGPVSNNGCPIIEEEEQEILNTAFSNLEFETGKSIIKDVSFASLDELVKLFEKKEAFNLLIEGHTDNVGRSAANLYLSQNRALAVKNYLVSKGINTDRIEAKWYGEDKPIADNETKEGRQKNRRVEMTVVFD